MEYIDCKNAAFGKISSNPNIIQPQPSYHIITTIKHPLIKQH